MGFNIDIQIIERKKMKIKAIKLPSDPEVLDLPSDPEPIMIYESFLSYRVINPNTPEENE